MTKQLTKRGRERRRQLLDYATHRFAENGYHPTSVDDLVNGIGVGKGVFYWYFSSKEQLLVEILEDTGHDLRRAQAQAIGDETDAIKRLELGIRATMRWLAEASGCVHAVPVRGNAGIVRGSRAHRTETHVGRHRHRGEGFHRVGEGCRHVGADPRRHKIGVSNQLSMSLLIDRGQSPEVVADTAVSFCLRGLLGADSVPASASLQSR